MNVWHQDHCQHCANSPCYLERPRRGRGHARAAVMERTETRPSLSQTSAALRATGRSFGWQEGSFSRMFRVSAGLASRLDAGPLRCHGSLQHIHKQRGDLDT
jgi:hypothetical protein